MNYLFDDLKLPDMDRKKLAELETAEGYRILGYQRKGIPPRLAKRKSVVEKIKRRQAYKEALRNWRRRRAAARSGKPGADGRPGGR